MADEFVTKQTCKDRHEAGDKLLCVKIQSVTDRLDTALVSIDRATEKAVETVDRQNTIALNAVSKANELAAAQLEKRLETMNEFRGQLKDQAATFITRNEHNVLIKDISGKVDCSEFERQVKEIESLRLSRAEMAGKANQSSVNISYLIAVIGIIISIISVSLHFIK